MRELDEELGVSEKLRAEGHDALDASKIADDYRRMIDQFSNNVTDTTYKISNMLKRHLSINHIHLQRLSRIITLMNQNLH